jgi:hypothetical protein
MTVLVVNELLPGGWLEYLSLVKLEAKHFEAHREVEMNDANATDNLTAEQLALASAKAALSNASNAVSSVNEGSGVSELARTAVQMRRACEQAEEAGLQSDDPEFETVRRELERVEPMAISAVQTVLEQMSCDNHAIISADGDMPTTKLKEDLAQVQTGIEGALALGLGDEEQISNMKATQRILETRVDIRACDEKLGTLGRETPVTELRSAVTEAKAAVEKAGEVFRSAALSSEMASLAKELERVERIAVAAASQRLKTVLAESVVGDNLSLRELEVSRAEIRAVLQDATALEVDDVDTFENLRRLLHNVEVTAAGQRLQAVLAESVVGDNLSLRELEASRAEIRAAMEGAEALGVDANTLGNSRRFLQQLETLIAQAKAMEQRVEQGIWDTNHNSTKHTTIGKPRFMPLLSNNKLTLLTQVTRVTHRMFQISDSPLL